VIIEQQSLGSESCCIHHMFCACEHAFCTLSSSTVGRPYPTRMHRSWLPDSKLSHRNTIAFISLNAIQIFSESLRSGCPLCLLETLFRSCAGKTCAFLQNNLSAFFCAADGRIRDAKILNTSSVITWPFISIRHWGTLFAQSG